MKNLHIIPTDKQIKNVGDLVKDQYGDIHIFTKNDGKEYGKTTTKLNIYITNSKEIKEGDWCFLDQPLEYGFPNHQEIFQNKGDSNYLNSINNLVKKIILTTDDQLIKDGVQAIDDEFLEWFVKNPSCEKVEVVFNNRGITGTEKILKSFGEYKIIIPKETPKTKDKIMKQTAVEWLVDELLDGKPLMPSLIEQAKELEKEQQNSYSEEEVLPIIEYVQWVIKKIDREDTPQEIVRLLLFERDKIEQFKKK